MKVFFKTVHDTTYAEAMDLFKTFEPEWSLQRSTNSVRSVISSNVGRSVEKIRAAVNKQKVQKNIHPVKKQKWESSQVKLGGATSAGSSLNGTADKNCFTCGLPGHKMFNCPKKGGIAIPLGGQLAQPDINLTHYWDSIKKDWVKK